MHFDVIALVSQFWTVNALPPVFNCVMNIKVQVGKNVPDRFRIRNGLKQGDALSPMLFNFALEYAIRSVQVNQDGLKLNGTHHLLAMMLICWEEAYIL